MAKMNKDMLPLYIAITSGIFSLLSTITNNLMKEVKLSTVVEKSNQVITKVIPEPTQTIKPISQAPIILVKHSYFTIPPFILENPGLIIFGSISIIAIIVYFISTHKKKNIHKKVKL